MNIRIISLSIIVFLIVFICTLLVLTPVQFAVQNSKSILPDNIILTSPKGIVVDGSVSVNNPSFQEPLNISWNLCLAKLLIPVGFCVKTPVKGVDVNLILQPWEFGDTTNIYNIKINAPINDFVELHPSLSMLNVVSGDLITDINKVSFNANDNSISEINGDIKINNSEALGLVFDTVNIALSTNDDKEIAIAVDGGNIDQIKLQGSGTIVNGLLNIRFLLKSNSPPIQSQLSNFTKKISETEFEWTYNGNVF